ncbi:hypothetical protein GmHk_18G051539 [Glycine max]|nr:hypothetical protein GmHk_18G051539 [Glycine max]
MRPLKMGSELWITLHMKSLQVWVHIRDLAHFRRRFTSLPHITDSLIRGRSTSGVQRKLRYLAIAITVYCIWLSRNKLIFEDYQFSVIETNAPVAFVLASYRSSCIRETFDFL